MPFVERAGGRAFYVSAGEPGQAPAALLIHGAGGSHLDWPLALRRLPGRQTIALDLPGHGRSDPPGRHTIAGYADWVLSVLDVFPAPLLLIGHSMGSAIALEVALRAPQRAAGLVLIGAGARLPLPTQLWNADDPAAGLLELAYTPGAAEEWRRLARRRLAQTAPAVLRGDLWACVSFDARPRLGALQTPALLIVGRQDRLTPPWLAEELHARLPHSRLVIIENAGHMVIFEQTSAVLAAIQAAT